MSLIEACRHVLAPPHWAGRPFILGGIVAILLGLAVAGWLAWLGLLFTLFCFYFFRDPERVPPGRPSAILAPADGRVVSIAPAVPPLALAVRAVHITPPPADGTVTRIAYRHGAFVSAALDKASEANERNAIALRLPDG